MKKACKLILSASITSVVLLSNLAVAQPMTGTAANNWTGFYGGLNIGGVFNNTDLHANQIGLIGLTGTCDTSTNFSSFFPGVQVGYLRQLQSKVALGVEGDFTYNVDRTNNADCHCPFTPGVSDHFVVKNNSQGSIRGRLGYLVKPNLLPFVSAGASFAGLGVAYNNESGDYSASNSTRAGWLAGAGLEWGFASAWSVRAEYYYIDYNNLHMGIPTIYGLNDPNGGATLNTSNNNVRLAVNYWFG